MKGRGKVGGMPLDGCISHTPPCAKWRRNWIFQKMHFPWSHQNQTEDIEKTSETDHFCGGNTLQTFPCHLRIHAVSTVGQDMHGHTRKLVTHMLFCCKCHDMLEFSVDYTSQCKCGDNLSNISYILGMLGK